MLTVLEDDTLDDDVLRRLTEPDEWFAPQPQDLVITLLGAYVRAGNRTDVWSGGLVELLGEFGFSVGAARVALGRLVRRELIAKRKRGRLVSYTLTERSDQLLREGDRRIFSLGSDARETDVWTVLWHTLPERQRTERARLARRLRFLGFGAVQDGTWASPHDREDEVAALLHTLGAAEHAVVLVGHPAAALSFRGFVERAWDLEELAARYSAFVREFSPYLDESRRSALSDRGAFLLRTRAVHTFRAIPFLDPGLPDSYLPEPNHRGAAVAAFTTLYAALGAPAQRYFDEVTAVPGLIAEAA